MTENPAVGIGGGHPLVRVAERLITESQRRKTVNQDRAKSNSALLASPALASGSSPTSTRSDSSSLNSSSSRPFWRRASSASSETASSLTPIVGRSHSLLPPSSSPSCSSSSSSSSSSSLSSSVASPSCSFSSSFASPPPPSSPSRGDYLLSEASKSLSWFNVFDSSRYSTAIELYQQAATLFLFQKNYRKAILANEKLAVLYGKKEQKMEMEEGETWIEMGRCWKLEGGHEEEAEKWYRKGAQRMIELNLWQKAAKAFEEIGKMSAERAIGIAKERIASAESDGGGKGPCSLIANDDPIIKLAIDSYTKASECWTRARSTLYAVQSRISIADLYLRVGDYRKSSGIYEKEAHLCLDEQVNLFAIRDYFVKSLLAQFYYCTSSSSFDLEWVQESLGDYLDSYPQLINSQIYQLIQGCVAAIEESDLDKITQIIQKYDDIYKMDNEMYDKMGQMKDRFERMVKGNDEDAVVQ